MIGRPVVRLALMHCFIVSNDTNDGLSIADRPGTTHRRRTEVKAAGLASAFNEALHKGALAQDKSLKPEISQSVAPDAHPTPRRCPAGHINAAETASPAPNDSEAFD